MKIAIICISLEGGVGRVCREVKKELVKRGHKVKIIERGSSFSNIWIVRQEIKDEKYDVIYCQDWSCSVGFLFDKKQISCFHGNNPNFGYYIQTLIGRILGKKLIVVGPSLKERFPKSTMIYNGVNTKEFYDLKKPRKYFGCIDKKTEMYSEKDMREEAEEYDLPLLVAKDIPKDKMNEFYNKCEVFASYPPYSGSFNLCWLEARASGVQEVLGINNGIGIHNIDNLEQFSWNNHVNKLLEIFNLWDYNFYVK